MKLNVKFDGIKLQFMNGIGFGLYRHNELCMVVDPDDPEDVGVMPVNSITLQLPFCRVMFFTFLEAD